MRAVEKTTTSVGGPTTDHSFFLQGTLKQPDRYGDSLDYGVCDGNITARDRKWLGQEATISAHFECGVSPKAEVLRGWPQFALLLCVVIDGNLKFGRIGVPKLPAPEPVANQAQRSQPVNTTRS